MTTTGVLLLASTCLYAGFQWTIRVVVYPQFPAVGPDEFVAYEGLHQRRVSFAVGPLFAFFGGSALAALVVEPGVASGVTAGCFAAILAVTAFAAVPLHRRLAAGFDPAAHRRLVIVDSVRLALAVAACVGAVAYS